MISFKEFLDSQKLNLFKFLNHLKKNLTLECLSLSHVQRLVYQASE